MGCPDGLGQLVGGGALDQIANGTRPHCALNQVPVVIHMDPNADITEPILAILNEGQPEEDVAPAEGEEPETGTEADAATGETTE